MNGTYEGVCVCVRVLVRTSTVEGRLPDSLP